MKRTHSASAKPAAAKAASTKKRQSKKGKGVDDSAHAPPPADQSSASTSVEGGISNGSSAAALMPEPSGAEDGRPVSPDPNCSICLCPMDDKSFTHSCFHMFCFTCLLEWSKVKAVCPLCKQPFKSIIHNIRSETDYDVYDLKDSAAAAPPAGGTEPSHLPSYLDFMDTPFGAVPAGNGFDLMPPLVLSARLIGSHAPPFLHFQFPLFTPRNLEFRRNVYQTGRRAREIQLPARVSYRLISPAYFADNISYEHRQIIANWLHRELTVLVPLDSGHRHYLHELIMSMLERLSILSEDFYEHLIPFLGDRTRLFINELFNFARSPLGIEETDRRMVYEDVATNIEVITLDRDDSDVEIVSSPDGVRNSRRGTLSAVDQRPDHCPPRSPTQPGELDRQPLPDPGSSRLESPVPGPSHFRDQESRRSCVEGNQVQEVSDSESSLSPVADNEIMFVKFDKPWKARTPISLSSDGSDIEVDEGFEVSPQSTLGPPETMSTRTGSESENIVDVMLSGETSHSPDSIDRILDSSWSEFSFEGSSDEAINSCPGLGFHGDYHSFHLDSCAGDCNHFCLSRHDVRSSLIQQDISDCPHSSRHFAHQSCLKNQRIYDGNDCGHLAARQCRHTARRGDENRHSHRKRSLSRSWSLSRRTRKRKHEDCADSGVIVDVERNSDSADHSPRKPAFKKHNRGHKRSLSKSEKSANDGEMSGLKSERSSRKGEKSTGKGERPFDPSERSTDVGERTTKKSEKLSQKDAGSGDIDGKSSGEDEKPLGKGDKSPKNDLCEKGENSSKEKERISKDVERRLDKGERSLRKDSKSSRKGRKFVGNYRRSNNRCLLDKDLHDDHRLAYAASLIPHSSAMDEVSHTSMTDCDASSHDDAMHLFAWPISGREPIKSDSRKNGRPVAYGRCMGVTCSEANSSCSSLFESDSLSLSPCCSHAVHSRCASDYTMSDLLEPNSGERLPTTSSASLDAELCHVSSSIDIDSDDSVEWLDSEAFRRGASTSDGSDVSAMPRQEALVRNDCDILQLTDESDTDSDAVEVISTPDGRNHARFSTQSLDKNDADIGESASAVKSPVFRQEEQSDRQHDFEQNNANEVEQTNSNEHEVEQTYSNEHEIEQTNSNEHQVEQINANKHEVGQTNAFEHEELEGEQVNASEHEDHEGEQVNANEHGIEQTNASEYEVLQTIDNELNAKKPCVPTDFNDKIYKSNVKEANENAKDEHCSEELWNVDLTSKDETYTYKVHDNGTPQDELCKDKTFKGDTSKARQISDAEGLGEKICADNVDISACEISNIRPAAENDLFNSVSAEMSSSRVSDSLRVDAANNSSQLASLSYVRTAADDSSLHLFQVAVDFNPIDHSIERPLTLQESSAGSN